MGLKNISKANTIRCNKDKAIQHHSLGLCKYGILTVQLEVVQIRKASCLRLSIH